MGLGHRLAAQPRMRWRWLTAARLLVGALLAAIVAGCWSAPAPPPWLTGPATRDAPAVAAPQGAACRPALTGELIVNEVLAAPGDQDIDGDGWSNARDEAVELRYDGAAPGHLGGAELWVGGKRRGAVQEARCLDPGTLVVLTGHLAATMTVAPGGQQLRLSGPLELPDKGAEIEVRGVLGTALGRASYPPASAAVSLCRDPEGDRWAPLSPHPPLANGVRQSIGHCTDGSVPSACWPPLGEPAGGELK